ncbi:transglutaminase-like domain-containing protein [Agathobaculum butyriciproducens]|uniref:transglutaminase-like domain-containing protein n=1 Tax=Agathobaculum butyriciproducens TaxID=1628085 RepID=UPI003A8DB065
MKRLFRHACAMLAVLLVMSLFTVVNASAANGTTIDTTNAKYGFVTVNYTSNAKLKVGIQYGSEKVSYKNCPSGKDAVFSLEQGDGTYTIFLCENISGTTYRVVTSKKVNAKIENAYAPYLIATTDVQFTSGDDVCKKAAELCKDAKTDMDKVTAIYNYIAGHYTYDTKLANDITSGKVSKYIPDTAATLNSNKGICYDLASLFAAMCRSQDIPCTLTKGYAGSSYHAWNKVNISGNWSRLT